MLAITSGMAIANTVDAAVARYSVAAGINIGATIHNSNGTTADALWKKGTETVTSQGDKVITGHLVKSNSGTDIFVKIWYYTTGEVTVTFLHVSGPTIDVYSDYSYEGSEKNGTVTADNRYIQHEYIKTDVIPFDSDQWTFEAKDHRTEEYLGEQSLYLKGGYAYIPDANFTDGIIEFDIALDSELYAKDKGFISCIVRMQDVGNYEKFYMRPHRLFGEEDAFQACPVYDHWSTWQLYYKKHTAGIQYLYDQWVHMKIVISGKYAETYYGDMETPVLTSEFKRDIMSGGIGLKADTSAPGWAHFANFRYVSMSNIQLKSTPEAEIAQPGTITTWMVSNTFDATTLKDKLILTAEDIANLTWDQQAADPSTGITPLSVTRHIATDPTDTHPGADTVFVRATITSDKDQIKQLQFGFTDKVKVYLNGQILYSENNAFATRDYRFMGTVGYTNELYLPLKKGENELWIAVTGLFASWGLEARLQNIDGVKITSPPL